MEEPRRKAPDPKPPIIPRQLREELYMDQRELASERLGGADAGDWVLLAVMEVASKNNPMAVPVMSILHGRKFMRRYQTFSEAEAAASEHVVMRRNGGFAVNIRSGKLKPVAPAPGTKHV